MAEQGPLHERAREALKGEPASELVAALLSEVQGESATVAAELARIEAAAADPMGSVDDAIALEKQADVQRIAAGRWAKWADLLGDALIAARRREENARRQKVYDAAVKRRDGVAKVLRERYPELCAEMLDLFGKIAEADQVVAAANGALPDGVASIAGVEEAARGVGPSAYKNGKAATRVMADIALPRFDHSWSHPFVWKDGKHWDPAGRAYH